MTLPPSRDDDVLLPRATVRDVAIFTVLLALTHAPLLTLLLLVWALL